MSQDQPKKKLFFIHGWTYNLEKSEALRRVLLEEDNIQLIRLKVPGLTTKSDEVWDIDGYVEWLREELKNEKDPIVMGHSNGGRIALSYLQKYPNAFKKLVLIDSAGVPQNRKLTIVKLKIFKHIAKVGKIFSFIPLVRKVFYRLIGASDYSQARPNMKLTMRNMLDADKLIDFSKITIPTTIIWGRKDKITPLRDGKIMHEKIQHSDWYVIEGAGHAPQASHVQDVADIIATKVFTD